MRFQCPHCQTVQIVTDPKQHTTSDMFRVGHTAHGKVAIFARAVGCANEECQKITVDLTVAPSAYNQNGNIRILSEFPSLFSQRIFPFGSAKILPDYVPVALREDYAEACLIKDLSPKASATLIRRCLQGMIRDFCGISEKSLYLEISKLAKMVAEGKAPEGVSIESVEAINDVRSVGNIGAHMEADINQVVTVEPGEAQILIDLTESLFDEWYVARHKRQLRFGAVKALAESKKTAQSDLKTIGNVNRLALMIERPETPEE